MNLKIFTDNIEEQAREQINTLLAQEAFSESKVRIMPDVHAGKGCVIGFTADLGDKVIPNLIGVDIGCGVYVAELGDVALDPQALDQIIRDHIPFGRDVNEGNAVHSGLSFIDDLICKPALHSIERIYDSIGSLGGGNHFIEVDMDDGGDQYLVIHTGSRNLGKQVAEYYQALAVSLLSGKDEYEARRTELIAEYKAQGRANELQSALDDLKKEYKAKHPNIPVDLCYLTGEHREDYLHDMRLCQEFAEVNRRKIAQTITHYLGVKVKGEFQSVHNYLDLESNIIRKGAISARAGERLIIPINMRDGCIIGRGKGNDDWNQSAPHGAGRIMSRMKAKETLDLKDYKASMRGIYTTSVSADTIDEAPMAYKPMQEIIANIEPTVEIEKIIHPLYNFKAPE